MDQSNPTFKFLGSNIRDTETKSLFHTVLDIDTFEIETSKGIVKIGVFGLCTEQTPQQSHPTADVMFEDVVHHARRCVDLLRSPLGPHRCDVIVCLSHVRLDVDKSIAEIDHIDVIIGGHDHDPYVLHHHNTLIVKCGMNLDYLGIVDLNLELVDVKVGGSDGDAYASTSTSISQGRKVSLAHSIQLLSSHGVPTDPHIDSIIQYWTELTRVNSNKNDQSVKWCARLVMEGSSPR